MELVQVAKSIIIQMSQQGVMDRHVEGVQL